MTNFTELLQSQDRFFTSGKTRAYGFRRDQLKKLENLIRRHEKKIADALFADFKKPEFEAFGTEISLVLSEIRHTLWNLRDWMRPQVVGTPLATALSRAKVLSEPKGRVLIIAPWNYPFYLLMAPLVGALAAGNVMVLKPSELAPHTAEVINEIISDNFTSELMRVEKGGPEVSEGLLRHPWDHIFFTGSTRVGRLVAQAAAHTLSPLTLELGGKSPALVDSTAAIKTAAKRIVWGKCVNAGQTCVAPDYVVVHSSVKSALIEEMKKVALNLYSSVPEKSRDFARIINDQHYQRLKALLHSGGKVVFGGKTLDAERFIGFSLIDGVTKNDPLMKEEIFGPLLPILSFDTLREAVEIIQWNPKPLALYVFSSEQKTIDLVMNEVPFGGGCINDTLVHLAAHDLPFGGIGPSGQGAYHGHWSFQTFSHMKSVLNRAVWLDPSLRYAPYRGKLAWLRRLIG